MTKLLIMMLNLLNLCVSENYIDNNHQIRNNYKTQDMNFRNDMLDKYINQGNY